VLDLTLHLIASEESVCVYVLLFLKCVSQEFLKCVSHSEYVFH